jgi:hypothetical protein
MGSRENWRSIGAILRGILPTLPPLKGVSEFLSAATKKPETNDPSIPSDKDCKREIVCFVDCKYCKCKSTCNPMIGL